MKKMIAIGVLTLFVASAFSSCVSLKPIKKGDTGISIEQQEDSK